LRESFAGFCFLLVGAYWEFRIIVCSCPDTWDAWLRGCPPRRPMADCSSFMPLRQASQASGLSKVVTSPANNFTTSRVRRVATNRLIASHTGKTLSVVRSAQRHKGGGSGPRPQRGTAAELSAPPAVSRTKQAKRSRNRRWFAIMGGHVTRSNGLFAVVASSWTANHPLAPSGAKNQGWARNPK
jgi:hypothetical protein